MIRAHNTGMMVGRVGTKVESIDTSFLNKLDELTQAPQRIIKQIPTT